MTKLTKQGVRDLSAVGGAVRRGRPVSALDQCLASKTHRMRHVRTEHGLYESVDVYECSTCRTVELETICPADNGWW